MLTLGLLAQGAGSAFAWNVDPGRGFWWAQVVVPMVVVAGRGGGCGVGWRCLSAPFRLRLS